jgi:hypothetical protein
VKRLPHLDRFDVKLFAQTLIHMRVSTAKLNFLRSRWYIKYVRRKKKGVAALLGANVPRCPRLAPL